MCPSKICPRRAVKQKDTEEEQNVRENRDRKGDREYRKDRKGGGGVAGDPETVGPDEEVVLPPLGEGGVAIPDGRLLGLATAELAADESRERDHGRWQDRISRPYVGRHR